MLTQKQVVYTHFLKDPSFTTRYHIPGYDALKAQNLINVLLNYKACSANIIDKIILDKDVVGKKIIRAVDIIDKKSFNIIWLAITYLLILCSKSLQD